MHRSDAKKSLALKRLKPEGSLRPYIPKLEGNFSMPRHVFKAPRSRSSPELQQRGCEDGMLLGASGF